ncbi:hypothetical protein [Brucella anthropi]|uniref:hypothetical protein n=1 Tax=Brucella anthropi TaxID=529 RepID=UPI0002898E53|nr:hypothetical protein [Brucella anthropi]
MIVNSDQNKVTGIPYVERDYDPRGEMITFDTLPSRIRQKIANAVGQIDVETVAECLHWGLSVTEICNQIDMIDQHYVANAYADRGVWHG